MTVSTLILIQLFIIVMLVSLDIIMAIRFIYALYNCPGADIDDKDCPPVAVILCLRGADPSLDSCLDAILQQDYPDYYLHAVIDSDDDPAKAALKRVARRHKNIRIKIEVLKNIQQTCSLKCSSQLQAIKNISPKTKIVAFLDADTIPYPYWLRTLVTPLVKQNAGASTGIRWFLPNHSCWGSTLRYIWNAGAQVQMLANRIAWGGSLAIKREILEQTSLLTQWEHSFGEDTSLNQALDQIKAKLVIIPSLIMVNNEKINIVPFLNFLRRQLVSVKLHHNHWPHVVGYGLILLLAVYGSIILLIPALYTGRFAGIFLLLVFLFGYEMIMLILLLSGERLVRRKIYSDTGRGGWLDIKTFFRLLLSIPLSQILYAYTMIGALFTREIEWRGVKYTILGEGKIELVEYSPYCNLVNDNEKSI